MKIVISQNNLHIEESISSSNACRWWWCCWWIYEHMNYLVRMLEIIFKPCWATGGSTIIALFIFDNVSVLAMEYVSCENKKRIILFIRLKLLCEEPHHRVQSCILLARVLRHDSLLKKLLRFVLIEKRRPIRDKQQKNIILFCLNVFYNNNDEWWLWDYKVDILSTRFKRYTKGKQKYYIWR